MRTSLRLLATATRSTAQYLEPGAPTGITGLATHASPRSTLLYLYHTTLQKLAKFPQHSIYRQSTEALTKQRMAIVESTIPEGLTEWQSRIAPVIEAFPDAFRKIPAISGKEGEFNVIWRAAKEVKEKKVPEEWDGEDVGRPMPEGPRNPEEKRGQGKAMGRDFVAEAKLVPEIESEPRLTAGQIVEMEGRIGAGLIEEVIQVAEGEGKLVDVLLEHQVWEDLEEKPQGNQWTYNERDTYAKTQAP